MKYRRKADVVDAVQFYADKPETHERVNFGWPKEEGDSAPHPFDGKFWVTTVHGLHQIVRDGEWILKDERAAGVLVFSPEGFALLYEPVPA